MSKPNVTPERPLRIPRFVQRLNEFAASRGVAVEVEFAPYDDGSELQLWSRWRATRQCFLGLGLLHPSQHLPLARGYLTVPPRGPYARSGTLLAGEITVTADAVVWDIDFGPGAFELTERDGVETVTYADGRLLHGSAEALIAAGVDRKRLPATGTRGFKRGGDSLRNEEAPGWWARRQLDAQYVYYEESVASWQRRMEEQKHDRVEAAAWLQKRKEEFESEKNPPPRPSHLRLVWSNPEADRP